MLNKQENNARFELYSKGYSDGMIARELYVARSAIAHWRVKNNLVSNFYKKSKEENAKRFELYNAGCTDGEIAEKCGVTQNTVRVWRYKNKLRCNYVVENRSKIKR